jgi:hypothetical protein
LQELIKTDEQKFLKKTLKMKHNLNEKRNELEKLAIKRREKEQEKRIGILKLKELKRIIKQHKLKPAIQKTLRQVEEIKTSRNKKLEINQSYPVMRDKVDLQYGDTQPEERGKSNQSRIKLAKIEWKTKANVNSLHKSAVDLRDKYRDANDRKEEKKQLNKLREHNERNSTNIDDARIKNNKTEQKKVEDKISDEKKKEENSQKVRKQNEDKKPSDNLQWEGAKKVDTKHKFKLNEHSEKKRNQASRFDHQKMRESESIEEDNTFQDYQGTIESK